MSRFDALTVHASCDWVFIATCIYPDSGSQAVLNDCPYIAKPSLAEIMIQSLKG